MASPQKENGFTPIAHELVESFSRTYMSSQESKVLWAIIRKTYGYQKPMDRISFTQFEKMTGMNRWHISNVIKRLVDRKIITRHNEGHSFSYGIQKDYELWCEPLPKKVTVQAITQTGNTPLPKQVTKALPKQVNTIDKNNIQKKKRGLPTLPNELSEVEGFSEIWNDWVQYRKEIKKPLTSIAVKRQFNKLMKFKNNGHDVMEIVDTSIRRGWQDFFEPRENTFSYRNNGHKEAHLDDY